MEFASRLWYTKCNLITFFYNQGGDQMPNAADIVRDSINEFSRLQDWMELVKENNDMITYNAMYKRYIEL